MFPGLTSVVIVLAANNLHVYTLHTHGDYFNERHQYMALSILGNAHVLTGWYERRHVGFNS